MRNYKNDRTLAVVFIVVALIALVSTVIVRQEAIIIVFTSFLLAYALCLYLRRFTPLSSKRWLKRVDKAIRVALLICALLLLVLFVIYDWPAV